MAHLLYVGGGRGGCSTLITFCSYYNFYSYACYGNLIFFFFVGFAVATGMPTVVGDSIFAITQSAAFLSTGLSANATGHTLNGTATATAAAATSASIPSGNAAAAATFVPSNAVLEQSLCQLQQLMAKGLLNPATPATNAIVSSGTVVGTAGGGYFVTAGPPAATTVTANGSLDTKKKELVAQSQPSVAAPGERRKRQKPLKNCAVSVMVAPQQQADEMANATAVSGATANSYTLYQLPPSSMSGPVNGGSAEGKFLKFTFSRLL